MTDPFFEFDKEIRRSQRRADLFFNLVAVVIVLIFVAMIVCIGAVAWSLYRLGDDGIARELGHTVGTFMKAMKS